VLSVEPAVATTQYDLGDFSWTRGNIAPGPGLSDHSRLHTFRPYYQGPAYSYSYGPVWGSYDHEFVPGISFWEPSF
jgi:hypothetical protein